jgi:hypothetical protein
VPDVPPEEDAPDVPPDDDVLDEPPDDAVPDVPPDVDDDELDVSSLPPHAAIAVALAKRIAARVATRPVGAGSGLNAGSSASQNGHDVSLARTCRLQSGHGLRLATKRAYHFFFGAGVGCGGAIPASATGAGPYTDTGLGSGVGG